MSKIQAMSGTLLCFYTDTNAGLLSKRTNRAFIKMDSGFGKKKTLKKKGGKKKNFPLNQSHEFCVICIIRTLIISL